MASWSAGSRARSPASRSSDRGPARKPAFQDAAVRGGRGRDRRAQPDDLLGAHRDAAPLELVDHVGGRCLVDAEQVHGQLNSRSRQLECERLHAPQAGAGFADRARERSRGDEVDVEKHHVEGDERLPCADADRARGGVEVWPPDVRPGSPRPDIGQGAAFAMAVEVHGNLEFVPHVLPRLVRELASRVERAVAQRDDRDDVSRADPGMHAAVLAQIDSLDCGADRAEQAGDHSGPCPGKRDDGAVVVGIGVDVEHVRLARGGGDGVDHIGAAAFRKVRHRLEKLVCSHSSC